MKTQYRELRKGSKGDARQWITPSNHSLSYYFFRFIQHQSGVETILYWLCASRANKQTRWQQKQVNLQSATHSSFMAAQELARLPENFGKTCFKSSSSTGKKKVALGCNSGLFSLNWIWFAIVWACIKISKKIWKTKWCILVSQYVYKNNFTLI